MKDFKKLQEMDRRMRELAGLYAAERERADSLAEELRTFSKIREHYEHAKEKHPYFCDYIDRHTYGIFSNHNNNLILTDKWLKDRRRTLNIQANGGFVNALTVLDCKVVEFEHAVIRGEKEHAVEKCYDAIAVLLRVVDVLEGRQALGDPAKKEGAK